MNDIVRILLQILATSPVLGAQAGTLYRCDDGGAASIYQTWPCHGRQRLVERRSYVQPVPDAKAAEEHEARTADEPARAARRGPANPATAPRRTDRSAPTAFLCTIGEREWVQSTPCQAEPKRAATGRSASTPRLPRQSAITRDETCRRVRGGDDRGATHERASDSTYRRNLMRDRENC